jgi:predicted RNA binding protein YcfA (HicA-like mRNA interferase family)
MNYRELRKKLQTVGWTIRSGGSHDKAIHPDRSGELIAILVTKEKYRSERQTQY